MKNIFFFLLLVTCAISSCKKDDSNDCEPTSQHALDGEWHLISVFCECEPVLLEPGEHIWTLDVAAGSLEVQDNTTQDWHTIPEAGSYELIVTGDSLYYTQPYGFIYYIENGDLYLDQQSELDGPLIRLIRP